MKFKFLAFSLLLILILPAGCYLRDLRWRPVRPPKHVEYEVVKLETTAYTASQSCCNWERNWWGRPVIASGPNKGKPKKVGITASGTRAKKGTIAADTRIFPFGTVMYVPGYGYGRVEDRGGAIKGNIIDLFFRSDKDAIQWGRQVKDVKVWRVPNP